jgi:hypothetical protein
LYRARSFVGNPSVTIPARPFLVNHAYRCSMAANAVCPQDLFPVFCDLYPFWCQAGKEEPYVFYAVNRFPDIVDGHIIVRQMAVNAFLSPVRPGVRPCLILCVHHVTSAAEERRLGPRKQLWRTQQQKEKYHGPDRY